jgi:hypothetical protein
MRRLLLLLVLAGCGRVQTEGDPPRGGQPAQVVSAGGRLTGGGLVVDVQLGGAFLPGR